MLAPDRRTQTYWQLEPLSIVVTLCDMRRLVFAALAVVAVGLVIGCGSSSTSGAPSPTVQTLSYFPSTAPFVLTVQTDPHASGAKDRQTLERRFPQSALLQTALFAQLAKLGIDYNKDIKPLYGNPIAVGLLRTQSATTQTPFLGVWITRSQSALATLVKKLGASLHSSGTHDGAKLYSGGGGSLAIDGPTVLLARTPQDIETALDRHKNGQGISAADYAALTSGLPSGSLVQMFGDLAQVLSTPQAAKARQIPWVAAIKGYGVAITATAKAIAIHFHIDTTGRPLSASQLPLAAGASSPGVASSAPLQMGLRNLIQPIQFLESAVQATTPGQYATFTRRVSRLKRRAGFDLNAFIATLTGTFDISSDTKTTIARVGVANPAAVKTMISKLVVTPSLAFAKGTKISALGGGLYELREASGTKLTLGVVADQLLAGKATPAEIRAFARAPTSTVPGATGAASFRVGLVELLHITLKRTPSPAAQQLLGLLGDLTGSVSATPSGMSGTATLALK